MKNPGCHHDFTGHENRDILPRPMRRFSCVAFALAAYTACSADSAIHLPPEPTEPDAGSAADAKLSPDIQGHVCALLDPRSLTECATDGITEVSIELNGATALVAEDGSFSITVPYQTDLVWGVAGTNFVISMSGYSYRDDQPPSVPIMPSNIYTSMASGTGITIDPTAGALIVHTAAQLEKVTVTSDGGSGATVATTLYPSTNPDVWSGDDTGPTLAAWIPNLAPGAWGLTSSDGTTATAVVIAGRITFVTL